MLRRWIGPILLFGLVVGALVGLAAWKYTRVTEAIAAAQNRPEPMESVTASIAKEREHRRTTTSIGTVIALRSITLRNELAGTVSKVALTPGQIVESGTILVALDTSVEEAELKAQEAQLALAEAVLKRARRASQGLAVPEEEVDKARAERDIALAQIARTRAIIARKTIKAPFRARVGLSDVHIGQYLNEGTQLTTLQGVDPAAHVDFTVAQWVAASLRPGDSVDVVGANGSIPTTAKIVALDARIDATTRNAMVRARIEDASYAPAPGASVRVRIPVGPTRTAVSVPVSALRRGPAGDHVFVLVTDKDGKTRAHMRKVESGAVLGDEVLILNGLSAGERVAAGGSFKLREGVLVVVAVDAPAADPGK
jgi:membrane fusion protein (multidrug efflux system)